MANESVEDQGVPASSGGRDGGQAGTPASVTQTAAERFSKLTGPRPAPTPLRVRPSTSTLEFRPKGERMASPELRPGEETEPLELWDEVYINSFITHAEGGTHEPDMGLFTVINYDGRRQPIRQKVKIPQDVPGGTILKTRLPGEADAYYLLHTRDSFTAQQASRAVNEREGADSERIIRLADHLSPDRVKKYKEERGGVLDWNETYLPQLQQTLKTAKTI